MKAVLLTGAFLLLLTMEVFADPPPADRPHRRGYHPERAERWRGPDDDPSASPMRRWMRELKEQNPREFERLLELRRTNPAAYRREALPYVQKQLLENVQETRPRIYQAIIELPEEDRIWLFERLSGHRLAPHPQHPGDVEPSGPPETRQRIRELVHNYHRSTDPRERAEIRGQIEIMVGEMYDRRLNFREEELREAEEKLKAIRRAIELGQQSKESFIEEKLSIWLAPRE